MILAMVIYEPTSTSMARSLMLRWASTICSVRKTLKPKQRIDNNRGRKKPYERDRAVHRGTAYLLFSRADTRYWPILLYQYVVMGRVPTEQPKTDFHLVSNVNSDVANECYQDLELWYGGRPLPLARVCYRIIQHLLEGLHHRLVRHEP